MEDFGTLISNLNCRNLPLMHQNTFNLIILPDDDGLKLPLLSMKVVTPNTRTDVAVIEFQQIILEIDAVDLRSPVIYCAPHFP